MYHVLRMQVVHSVRNVDRYFHPQGPTQFHFIVFQFCLKITALDKLRYNINTYNKKKQKKDKEKKKTRECQRKAPRKESACVR